MRSRKNSTSSMSQYIQKDINIQTSMKNQAQLKKDEHIFKIAQEIDNIKKNPHKNKSTIKIRNNEEGDEQDEFDSNSYMSDLDMGEDLDHDDEDEGYLEEEYDDDRRRNLNRSRSRSGSEEKLK